LGIAFRWIQQALVTAYEKHCPLKTIKNGRKSLKWTSELDSLIREVRRFLIGAGLIINQLVGKSKERLNGDIGGRHAKLLKRLGEPSGAP